MTLNRKIPIIECGGRRLTKAQAVAAIEHAEAFIILAKSQDEKQFGPAADEWLDKHGSKRERTAGT